MLGTVLTAVVPFLVIIVTLVVIHELGHFVTAKLAGVHVLEFGIGFPPRLWGKRIGETEYTVNALPLGGFVRMLGETDAEEVDTNPEGKRPGAMNTTARARAGEENPRTLAAKPRPVRIIVLGAGVLMNIVLAVLLFAIYYMVPQQVPYGQVQIARVSPNTPAAAAGLKPNDFIVQIDGQKMTSLPDVSDTIQLHQGQTMDWLIKRSGTLMHVSVYARFAEPLETLPNGQQVRQGPTGIELQQVGDFTQTQWYPPWEALPKGASATLDTVILTKNQIVTWIASRTAPSGLQGPVGIAQTTGEVVKVAGWAALLQEAATLSISLAIVNILPLPMLDGGRILFVVIEILRRGKRIAPEKEALVHLLGFALLMCLVVVISYHDILRIVQGDSLVK
ncbi:MAG TPA: M50 family metallopeptidase [Dehalococcoidia bacterium]|jgi:regulator of sigma E protease|nr:M50 family metallopeptidase [Dehalococcoidia bacterium]